MMTRHYPDLGSASDWLEPEFPRDTTNQKHYLDLGSDASSVWNFCARYSDVVLRGLKWRTRETSAVFSGYKDMLPLMTARDAKNLIDAYSMLINRIQDNLAC